ncbi:urotensin-2 [Camelus dromedarius]|uniref:Urotensin-2 n=2 Tax=Camelus TaxID=9836 RepID=A0A8B6YP66_CAMFR|nr:urotensin-2 [Camelus ferus]XP_010955897.1 urotensin-2 [Camelus bactrianus]XP_010999088.1 urotensin-2 [Camelus dromedarius]
MYKLASCCLLFIGCLSPLFSLPVLDSMEESLQLSAPEDVRSALDELERASLLQALPEMSGAETGDGLRKADASTNIFYPRGSVRKVSSFMAFSGQDPTDLLGHLLARIRKQHKKRGPPSECFWKYCV